ncbi:imidazole glycerol phosphate synthase subunit HisH [Paenibacillus sp. JMULE4]|uniref:imidazole glycerol phosphate synthase subunit HisH n=1 Tax=Paenibacillus sp. JMULE4 TaxID=2518342 RepID=UPI001C2D0236|nr:imidazole glycerol phosphate synthase subunit HisH [Paenibacillus sp. JMULE4]
MIVIIDYGMGNLGSIYNMIKKLGYNSVISSDIELIQQATKLVLPGVGAFDNGINNLNKYGIVPVLEKQVIEKKVPILGICLGMQLLTNSSEEGNCKGLGWINASTIRFKFEDSK